jgi:ribosomal protein S27E
MGLKKVNKYTRAGLGKIIVCPSCKARFIVYHFSWSALTCTVCKKMVNKYNYEYIS